jgi:FKBP-type peptidyl-prolyl cis-trans isomerase FkpA
MMSMFGRWLTAVGVAMMAMTPGVYAAAVANGAGNGSAAADASTPKSTQPAAAQPASDDKVFYALGVLVSRMPNLAALDLSDKELRQMLAGLRDGYEHHAKIENPESYVPQLQTLGRSRQQAVAERSKKAGAAFTAKVAQLPGAQKTASGLVYLPSVEGNGVQPRVTDSVKVLYTGKLIDGQVFDSSSKHGGQPATFALGGIIPCWKEALQLMKVGGKARVVCPSELAYGDRGGPPVIPPGSTLDFQIELLDVVSPPPQPRTPAVAMPNTPPPAHSAAPGSGANSPPR